MDIQKWVRENWVEIGLAGALAYWLFKSEKGKKLRDKALLKVKELIETVISAIDDAEKNPTGQTSTPSSDEAKSEA